LESNLFDVAVIGGGPVGSRVAFQLASRGYNVVVLEKHAAIGSKPCCTGIISQKCIDQFLVPEDVIFRHLNSAALYSPSRTRIQVSLPQPQAGIVNRPLLDRWMASCARLKGAKYQLDCEVKQVNVITDAVEIHYQIITHVCILKARMVVLACGFSSSLVKRMGMGQPAYQCTGVQTEVEVRNCQEIEVYFNQNIAPGFFAWIAPTSNGRALAGLMTRKSPGQRLRLWLDELESEGRINKGDHFVKQSGIPLKPLSSTAGERVVVVGDAAGQVKPTTGGGIYFGLLCADLAANSIHQAIEENNYSAKRLSSYEKEWRALLLSEISREYWARRAYQLLSNRQLDDLFKAIQRNGIIESLLNNEYTSFDNHGSLLIKALQLGLVSHAKRFSGYISR
jgi:digeranylgeranylglycerophospholipid reductase